MLLNKDYQHSNILRLLHLPRFCQLFFAKILDLLRGVSDNLHTYLMAATAEPAHGLTRNNK